MFLAKMRIKKCHHLKNGSLLHRRFKVVIILYLFFPSPEKSPKLFGRVDQLQRPGLHTTPPKEVTEQKDENISDGE